MIKLHLGCGHRNFGKDWIHIDGGNFSHLDSHDIVNLPFEDRSIDLIYASHVLEYFDRDEAFEVLRKWYTKLTPKGILRLAVPDFQAMATLYLKGQKLDSFLGPLYGKMKMCNHNIYHKTVYDFNSLANLLHQVGFSTIYRYDWKGLDYPDGWDDCSKAYLPHMDFDNGTLISLNVEAIL